jgi:hypothetical protein
MSPESASRWNPTYSDRLPNPDSIKEVIGDDGVFAVIYQPHDESIPIACAAFKPWKGDYGGYMEPRAVGWEVLTVTTRVRWMRRGITRRYVDALIEDLVERARKTEKGNSNAKVQIWIHAVEDLNRAYWKKQGWAEMRSYQRLAGELGSIEGYKLLVLLQEFDTRWRGMSTFLHMQCQMLLVEITALVIIVSEPVCSTARLPTQAMIS